MGKGKIYRLVLYALFIAIIMLLGLTPLGYIMLPIAAITTIHLPMIIGGYIFGVRGGALLGFFFGLTSFINCLIRPDATANLIMGTDTGFGPYNLVLIVMIIFIPRILAGTFSALCFKACSRHDEKKFVSMGVSAFVGSITNTIFYLGGMYLFMFNATGAMMGLENPTYGALFKVLLGIVSFNGVIEAVAAVIICTIIGKAIFLAADKGGIRL